MAAPALGVRAIEESMPSYKSNLEIMVAESIGKLILAFSSLELNVNLCLQWAVNAKDFHAVNPLVERLSFKSKIDALVEIVAIKFPSNQECVSDFRSWHKKMDKLRTKRNSFIHGRWAYAHINEEIVNVAPGMIGPEPLKETRYSVKGLEKELHALEEVLNELNEIRERWRV
ncbi:hypothetical protein [Microbulbifer sp. MCCC 1A16149]|uniref:hypothetical protein n=1 Tax=Microbulbifer sp. MCCC 1A16149 TaxID=3411322 RepID=UPI003D099B87